MDDTTIARMAESREQLRRLVAEASDADLARPLPDGSGWTVAATLAHLALWDRRAVVLIERWRRAGAIAPSHDDFDAINDALLPQWLALPPRAAAELAISAAEEADRAVATLTADDMAAIERAGGPIRTDRSLHRQGHLDAIARVLRGE